MTPDPDGARIFRAMIVCGCIGAAMLVALIAGAGRLLGVW